MRYVEIGGYGFEYDTRHTAKDDPTDIGQGRKLSDVYGSYSYAKARAWSSCEEMVERLNGWGLHITSHNCNFFTVGFYFDHPDTGEIMYCRRTARYNYLYSVE